MKTFVDHAESLARYCDETPEEIMALILDSDFIMDDDSLFCYSIGKSCFGNYLTIEWEDGDGEKMWEWIKKIASDNHCINIYFVSRRWKALCRKYKFHPVGILCKRRWMGNEQELPSFDRERGAISV